MATGKIKPAANLSDSGFCMMPDGTMMQWGRVSGIVFDSMDSAGGTLTLPEPFLSQSDFQITASPVNTTDKKYAFRMTISPASERTANWHMYTGTNEAVTVTARQFSWIAIGRWK